jgi:4'-phosphopantetheinyl transferase
MDGSLNWLHFSEQKVLSGFKFPKKRNDWVLGRWTAKNAVRNFLKKSHPRLLMYGIEIVSAEDGAPEVFYNGAPLPAFISLSHSHGTAFCVVSDPGTQLGCDLEKIEPRSELFVRDYFTKNEQDFISLNDKASHTLWANLVWSAKESALKALRLGLSIDTRSVEVDFTASDEIAYWKKFKVTASGHGIVFQGYWRCASNFVLTVVTDAQAFELIEISDSNK